MDENGHYEYTPDPDPDREILDALEDQDEGETLSPMMASAIVMHELYLNYCDAGFTSKEALRLVALYVTINDEDQ